MQDAIDAYGQIAKVTQAPRELEASVLLKAAVQLQAIQDDWETSKKDLNDALYYNRKIWTLFATMVSDKENPLPIEIKNNIASLGVFVMNHTLDIQRDPAPEKLTSLISINREIAGGLHGKAEGSPDGQTGPASE